jgi:hypothetical protein
MEMKKTRTDAMGSSRRDFLKVSASLLAVPSWDLGGNLLKKTNRIFLSDLLSEVIMPDSL